MTTDPVDTSPGRVLRDPDGVRLEFVRSYPQPVPEVWAALTEPERLSRWFGSWTGDPSTGTVELRSLEDEAASTVHVLECRPPHRLRVDLPSPDGTWPLTLGVEERDGGARLRFVHRLAEPYDAGSIGPGWQYYLDRLGAVVAGAPVPDDGDAYYPALRDAYAVPR